MDALKEIAGLANHLRHGNVTLWAIADDEYCAEMGLTVEEQGETLSEFLHGVAERLDSEVRFTEGTSGKAIERADRYAEWLDDIEAELFGERTETFTHGDHERQSERISDILSVLENGAERLMPEDMNWPRFEDGEPVRTGDRFAEHGGCENVAGSIEIGDCWFKIRGFDGAAPRYSKGAVVKRPAPKVLDADGVEIHEGDTVWTIKDARELEVIGLYPEQDSCPVKVKECKPGARIYSGIDPDQLTHRAPAIAADGKPLCEGETVWTVDAGIRFEVHSIEGDTVWGSLDGDRADDGLDPKSLTHQRPVLDADGVSIHVGDTVYFTDGRRQECNTVVHAKYDYKDEPYVQLGRLNDVGYPTYTNCSCIDPSQLTHTKPEPPDSWERLEEDAAKSTCEYFDHQSYGCGSCPHYPSECQNDKALDLVRRAKALAERGQ